MVRNIDLPECLIFYGCDTFFSTNRNAGEQIHPGIENLLKQANEVGSVSILLSESNSEQDLQVMIDQSPLKKIISARSCLDIGDETKFSSPSPLGLLKAIESVTVAPQGFGGSSGFGRKLPDPDRSPLPKHW